MSGTHEERAASILKSGALITSNGKMLVVRKHGTNLFILPGGKPEGGESLVDALVRELHEELSVNCSADQFEFIGEYKERAAFEEERSLTIALFAVDAEGPFRLGSEIEEAVWFGPSDDLSMLTPISRNLIVPDLIARKLIAGPN